MTTAALPTARGLFVRRLAAAGTLTAAWCAAAAMASPAAQSTGPAGSPEAPEQFHNVATDLGLDFRHTNGATDERHLYEIMGSGGLFFDYDADGWVDIFLVDGGSLADPDVNTTARHRLFHNRGGERFDDVTERAGIRHRAYGMGACAADYDNDGRVDLYITSVGPNVLYHNEGDGTFRDVTETAGVGSALFAASCAFADVDRDGDVDLFVTNYVDATLENNRFCGDPAAGIRIYCHPLNFDPLPDVLYRNEGDGRFTDVSREAGIGPGGNGLGVVFGDYDDDGWPDLFVANDNLPDFLYHNDGDGRFTEMGLLAGVSVAGDGVARAGMGTDFGDFDGDGLLDLFVTNHELETHTLFQNLGDGLFTDVTAQSGVGPATVSFVGFGTLFWDYDHDGDQDLAIANGHVLNSPSHFIGGAKEAQLNLLLRNEGAGRFTNMAPSAGPGFALEKISRALSAGDIDNDGDLDLLITNNGGAVDLLRNDRPPTGHALLVRLVGTVSNRDAIGARVRVSAGGRSQIREVKAGSSYLGQHDLRVHFGLGDAAVVDRLEIRWPSGEQTVLEQVAADRILTVAEGQGTAETAFDR